MLVERSHLNMPPQSLVAATTGLSILHDLKQNKMETYISNAITKLNGYHFPGRNADLLFNPSSRHAAGERDCSRCDLTQLQSRPTREYPVVHYGLIASSNEVVRDADRRDKYRRDLGILCWETEAAGVMNFDAMKCLVIRGICDYADSHKNNRWQKYAALTAAAYAKDLLAYIAPSTVDREPLWAATISTLLTLGYRSQRNDPLALRNSRTHEADVFIQ